MSNYSQPPYTPGMPMYNASANYSKTPQYVPGVAQPNMQNINRPYNPAMPFPINTNSTYVPGVCPGYPSSMPYRGPPAPMANYPASGSYVTPNMTGANSGTPNMPAANYPTSGSYVAPNMPSGGYRTPNMTGANSGAPNMPAANYPTSGSYVAPNMPTGGYRTPNMPGSAYPTQNMPGANYSTSNVPSGQYAPPNVPISNYDSQNMQVGGHGSSNLPSAPYDQVYEKAQAKSYPGQMSNVSDVNAQHETISKPEITSRKGLSPNDQDKSSDYQKGLDKLAALMNTD